MKIGLVIERFDPRRGGAEGWTLQYAQRLLRRGHEVHVVTQQIGGAGARLPIVPHCLGQIPSHLGRAVAAEAMLRRLDLDVIHDIGMGWHSHVLQSEDGSRIAQWEYRLKLLPRWLRPWKRRMIDVLPRYRDFRTLMARQFGDPNRRVIAVSKMCAGHYQQYHGVSPERIRLVYHGVDIERFSPDRAAGCRGRLRRQWGIGEEELVFVFVGHDWRRKGLATAIRAVARLADAGAAARLLVVGGKPHPPISRGKSSSRPTVLFAGPVDDPAAHYLAADAFVLPTFYDPCALSVMEAAACCLPSVTSAQNGASELLSEGVDGFVLADPADDRELFACLEKWTDPALRRRMGEAARRLALRFTLERNCDELLDVYREISPERVAA